MNNARRGFERPQLATPKVSPLEALNIAVGAANADRTYELSLTDIIVDQEIQVRVGGLDAETLAQYIAVLENEGELPPITVFRADDGEHYLADGFHRYRAHDETGKATIKCFVRDGNRQAAIEFAESANLEHGLKLTHEDKKNILYRRLERGHEWKSWSTRELGRVLGVGHNTVKRWLDEFQTAVPNGTGEPRIVRGADGKVYDTTNIGKTPRPARDDGYTPLTPDERAKARPALPEHHTYAHIDTGGEFPQLDDHSAAAVREGRVRLAVQQITAGIDNLLQNHSIGILEETPAENRKDLIAILIGAMVREVQLSQQLIATLGHDDAVDIEAMFVRVDNALNACADALKNQIARI